MSDLKRVNGPSSPLEGRSGKILTVVVAGILVALVKPWGTTGPAPAPPSAAPSAAAAATPPAARLQNYNPDVFGLYEPTPGWELWPAGYLVSFGFATRIDSLTTGSDAPSTPPDGSPLPSVAAASPTPVPTAPTVASAAPDGPEPVWPARITVSAGSHVSLIGINTPLGYRVTGVTLWQLGPGGRSTRVPTVLPPSPWPVHFTIMAMDSGNGRDPRDHWPPGAYRLDLAFEPGGISRQVEILIGGATEPTPSPSSSAEALSRP